MFELQRTASASTKTGLQRLGTVLMEMPDDDEDTRPCIAAGTLGTSGNRRRLQGHLQKQGGRPAFANPLRTGAAGCYVPFR
jgi:hypothetical protein